MTIQQQATYAPCPEGWTRFNFNHYRKVVVAKARMLSRQLKAITEEKNYQRPITIN